MGAFSLLPTRSGRCESQVNLTLTAPTPCVQVACRLTAKGHLKAKSLQGEAQEIPIEVRGDLAFIDRLVEADGQSAGMSHVRKYKTATAEIKIDGQSERTRLTGGRETIVARYGETGFALDCPNGPLLREDLELLETQFDVALLNELLPTSPVETGEKWTPPPFAVAPLLGLEAVGEADLTCVLATATDETAIIKISGKATGATMGAKSVVEVDGKITVDRAHLGVRSVVVDLKEKREIGQVSPGFELAARLEMDIQPASAAEAISLEQAKKIADLPSGDALQFASPALGVVLIHDRRWQVITHNRTLLVMRLVDRGDVLAQCNMTPLAIDSEHPGEEMARFRRQIEIAMQQYSGRLEEASQAKADGDRQILRIMASGSAEGVPITWIYYLLCDQDGRRAALAFTVETRNLARLQNADHQLVGGLVFLSDAQRQAQRQQIERNR